MEVYEKLKQEKDLGKKLDWDEITYEELYIMSLQENIPDSMIGDLYNVDKEVVKRKRYKWNIKITSANLMFASFIK